MPDWRAFGGVNEGYALELYERFRQDPSSVDAATRATFERMGSPAVAVADEAVAPGDEAAEGSAAAAAPPSTGSPPAEPLLDAVVGAVNLAEAVRRYGHLAAQLDPLGSDPVGDPSLQADTHGVAQADLEKLPASLVGGPLADGAAHAA